MKHMKRVVAFFLAMVMVASVPFAYASAAQENENTDIPAGYTPIYTIADLAGINSNPAGKYILMNDIDMTKETSPGGTWDTGHGWTPLDEFSGVFDGNGHYIIGMHIYGKYHGNIGLFSKVSSVKNSAEDAVIKNVGIVNCDINIIGESFKGTINIGGIAGFEYTAGFESAATISQCFVSGAIQYSGDNTDSVYIGGIVGKADYNSIVQDCYNMATISAIENQRRSGTINIGGIAGYDISSISNCYNMGNIDYPYEGSYYVGAIVGAHDADRYGIVVDDINNYYLNTSASGGAALYDDNSSGCKALTDIQMRTPNCFSGFDFKNTWMIDKLSSYPYPQLVSCPKVRVKNLQLVSLPDKGVYSQGDKLDVSGAVVSVTYEDGVVASTEVDSSMVSGVDMNKIGEQTVTVSYLNKTCSFDISVEEAEVTDISLSKTSCSISRNAKLQLKAVIKPSKAADKSVTWESDNEAVATVSKNGVVRGINAGSAVITVTTSNGLTAECIVTVKVPITGIRLNTTGLVLNKGKKKTIKAQGNFIKSTMFKSSNVKIATVSKKGVVIAKKAGSCNITVTVKYRKTKKAKKVSEKKLVCKVTVKKAQSTSSTKPTAEPTEKPTTEPTVAPTAEPTIEPTAAPTAEPTIESTAAPTAKPVTGSKDEKDVTAITAIIAEQKSLGATVSVDLDSDEYSWSENGRLTGISWGNKNLQGSLTLQGLSKLRNLAVDNCTDLVSLDCHKNQLTSLNVDNCAFLTFLDCSHNRLPGLDVSKCTALTSLHCNNNQLPEIDVSHCTALASLWCSSNLLVNLDVSHCTALTYLVCQDNRLMSLDVSHCRALKTLMCDMNELLDLDVGNCRALTELSCFDNQLEALDVSNCKELKSLSSTGNQLTSLAVGNCTALTFLDCSYNQLRNLDVSKCTALTALHCNNNELPGLDVSNCTALNTLWCSNNRLPDLSISNCKALTKFYCDNNQLAVLDVSQNTALDTLWCNNNQLRSLDISNCTALASFQCDANVAVIK